MRRLLRRLRRKGWGRNWVGLGLHALLSPHGAVGQDDTRNRNKEANKEASATCVALAWSFGQGNDFRTNPSRSKLAACDPTLFTPRPTSYFENISFHLSREPAIALSSAGVAKNPQLKVHAFSLASPRSPLPCPFFSHHF